MHTDRHAYIHIQKCRLVVHLTQLFSPLFRNIGLKADQVSDVNTHNEEEGKPDTANSDETPTAGADGKV